VTRDSVGRLLPALTMAGSEAAELVERLTATIAG
jgi:hypothetical protein